MPIALANLRGVLERKPRFITAIGEPGIGKSTMVAEAFQNALFITSASNVLIPYETRVIKETGALGYKYLDPDRGESSGNGHLHVVEVGIHEGPKGPVAVNPETHLRGILSTVEREGGYSAIVLDELSEMMARIDVANRGKKDGASYESINKSHDLLRFIMRAHLRIGCHVIAVCHRGETKYFDSLPVKDSKAPIGMKGKIQYKGGASLPIATQINQLAAMTDLQVEVVKEGGNRVLLLGSDDRVLRKVRDFRIPENGRIDLSKTSFRNFVRSLNISDDEDGAPVPAPLAVEVQEPTNGATSAASEEQ